MKITPKLLQAISLALLLPCAAPADAQTRRGVSRPVLRHDSIPVKKQSTRVVPKQDSLQQKQGTHDPKYCPPCGRG